MLKPLSPVQHQSVGLTKESEIDGKGKTAIQEAVDNPSPTAIPSDRRYPEMESSFDLAMKEIHPGKPCVERLVPRGVTFMGGAPKSCKTILATQISQAVGNGQKLFNSLETQKSEVLMLSLEDDDQSLKNRLNAMSPVYPPSPSVTITCKWGEDFGENMTYLGNYLEDNDKTGLVIIDTFEKFCGSGKKNSYSGDYSVIGKIKKMADEHKTSIVLVHHIIKNIPTNWVGAFYGSHGVAGAADGLLFLDRIVGTPEAKLHFTGRSLADGSLNLRLNTNFLVWELTNFALSLQLQPERRDIFNILFANQKPMRLSEIAESVGKSAKTVNNLLKKMVKLNLVIKVAHGVYAISNTVKIPDRVEPMEVMEVMEKTTTPTIDQGDLTDLMDSVDYRHHWS
jgi:predicted transcriptional regulator